MIVLWVVKELSVGWMHLCIILGELHVEILDPSQLTIDVTLLSKLSVVGHPCSLHFIFIVRVQLSLGVDHLGVSVLEVFAKVLLYQG